jgi:tetratricopeptide (TPR) repeat protein
MSTQHIREEVARIKDLTIRSLLGMAMERATALHEEYPDDTMVMQTLGDTLLKSGDMITAHQLSLKLIDIEPENQAWLTMATQTSLRTGHKEDALEYCGRLSKLTNNDVSTLLISAEIYERNNMPQESEEILDRIKDAGNRTHVLHLARARVCQQKKDYEEAIEHLKQAIDCIDGMEVTPDTDAQLMEAHFLMAKSYDRMKQYDEAWASATRAHAIRPTNASSTEQSRYFNEIFDFINKKLFNDLPRSTESTREPLFIVGQPRSGTSLLEQILSMHPDVANGGEMSVVGQLISKTSAITDSFLPWPKCILDLRTDDLNKLAALYEKAERDHEESDRRIVSNKALNLPIAVGLMSLMMPRSRAIMLRRNPLDNCISCYTTNLRVSGHEYAGTPVSLARTWVGRRKLQELWTETLDIPTMTLDYEMLVANQEAETRRIIDFLDLPWNEGCLEFHKSKRVATTISYDQVNQKMYKSSSGRWKNYEKHLGPMMDILEPYL